MALTKIITDGISDDAVTDAKLANAINSAVAANTAKTGLGTNTVQTAHIADEQITLAKLPHGTSSNDGKFLRANNGADPSFETISIPAGVGGATGVDFNDNVLARFGTGNDLELKHDGSHSYVGNNTGYLYLQSDSISLAGKSAGQNYLVANLNGALSLGHSGNTKLETTSTGINITGGIRLGGNNAVNELNDYEEGTYTPVVTGDSGTATTSTAYGVYTKIGRFVNVNLMFTLSSRNGISGSVYVSLPFTAGDRLSGTSLESNGVCVHWYDLTASSFLGVNTIQGEARARFGGVETKQDTNSSTVASGDITDSFGVRCTVSYFE